MARPLKFLIAGSLAEEAPRIAELLREGGYEIEWTRAEPNSTGASGTEMEIPGAPREPWDLLFPDYRRQLRAMNSELRDRVKQLERSNADLEQFAWAASHDLKEPLRTISNYTDLLVRRTRNRNGKPQDDPAEFARYIQQGVERMGAMIDGLLAYSRAMYQPLEHDHFTNAQTAAEEAVQTLHASIEESGARIEIDPLPVVGAEAGPLVQIFQNLLANALKYRSAALSPSIRISVASGENEVRFAVSDNGIGIAAEHYDRIFEVFRRLHGEDYEGLGVGLAICKRLVERYGGRIWLDSEPGSGSTFYFTLPNARRASASAKA